MMGWEGEGKARRKSHRARGGKRILWQGRSKGVSAFGSTANQDRTGEKFTEGAGFLHEGKKIIDVPPDRRRVNAATPCASQRPGKKRMVRNEEREGV